MRWLADYVMRGRAQAVLATLGLAILSLVFQPLAYLSGAAVALVTLRVGAGAGLFVAGAATVLMMVLSAWTVGQPLFGMAYLVGLWGPVWALAWVLRATIDLKLTLLAGAGAVMAAVAGMYLYFGDPAGFWLRVLDAMMSEEQLPPQLDEFKATLSQVMTAGLAIALYLGWVISLLLGRWWQSLLYYPGGFKKEFLSLRIGQKPAWGVVALSVWALVAEGGVGTLPTDLTVVAMAPFAIAGIALVHAGVDHKGVSAWWLVPLYVAMGFLLPQMLFALALVGLSDSWVDWRSRWEGKGPRPPAGKTEPQRDSEEGREEASPPRERDEDEGRGPQRVAVRVVA